MCEGHYCYDRLHLASFFLSKTPLILQRCISFREIHSKPLLTRLYAIARWRPFCLPILCLHSRYTEMRTAVQRWGNSLAIRIPRAFAQETRLGDGTEVDLQLKAGTLVIRAVRARRYRLSDLLAQVRKNNTHGETEWGQPVGREIW
jgi:antitoxin MazE